jgi:hypothetical protein
MSKVIDLKRSIRISRNERPHRPGECAHRHIKLDRHGGTVTCGNCHATLSPFWALEMLSEQYVLALANIDRLTVRLQHVNEHMLTLSAALDEQRSQDQERRGKK